MGDLMEEDDVFIPDDVRDEATEAERDLLPEKSKPLYKKEYEKFCDWRRQRNARGVCEEIILAYIREKSVKLKSSTVWSHHSMLKSTLLLYEKVDIGRFVIMFLLFVVFITCCRHTYIVI